MHVNWYLMGTGLYFLALAFILAFIQGASKLSNPEPPSRKR